MEKLRSSVAARCLIMIGVMILAVFNWNCAKKGFPEGGPPDETPPEIMSTAPASGEVSVPHTAELAIDFSEPVDRTTLLPNLFISPALNGTPDMKWSKRAVSLHWDDTLRTDITYRVTIGVKLADRHKNTLADPYTFAFSTGPQIDTGQIVGHVWAGIAHAANLDILAYRLDSADTWNPVADTLGGIAPEFVTQAGAEGGFDLPYLPPARFRVLAVGDRNRNLIPDPNEVIGIPARDADLTTSASPSLRIFTQTYDTTSFAIKSCAVSENGSILIGLTHPADTSTWRGTPFTVIDSASGEPLPVDVLRPVAPRFTVVPVVSAQFEGDHSYIVSTVADQPSPVKDIRGVALVESHCTLNYPAIVDSAGAQVTWSILPNAANALTPKSPVQFGFSEPVDTVGAGELLRLYDSIGTVIAGTVVWADARQVSFHPAGAWPETTDVLVTLDSTLLRDRHGNPPPSQTWTWRFTPLTESQMGAISCKVEVSDSLWMTRRCHVQAYPQGRDEVVGIEVAPNTIFELPLSAGPWTLAAFVDLNGDGRFSPGSLLPYTPAEPRVVRPDTVAVRARFTNEDIILSF